MTSQSAQKKKTYLSPLHRKIEKDLERHEKPGPGYNKANTAYTVESRFQNPANSNQKSFPLDLFQCNF